jgi:hypothetical protein
MRSPLLIYNTQKMKTPYRMAQIMAVRLSYRRTMLKLNKLVAELAIMRRLGQWGTQQYESMSKQAVKYCAKLHSLKCKESMLLLKY